MDQILPEHIPLVCNFMDNRDLLSLALSSRGLTEPALDVLWRYITSFKPLICCLPVDLLEASEEENGLVYVS